MTHQPAAPFAHTVGSAKPRIVFIGEAWGKDEEMMKEPFVGESGKEFFRMLGEAFPEVEPALHAKISELLVYGSAWTAHRKPWFEAAGFALTNVLALRPPDNKIEALCGKKKEVGGDAYTLPPVSKGKYLLPEYLGELDRLKHELLGFRPNLIVCLGNTACWAVLLATNISSIRGAVAQGQEKGVSPGVKTLGTYHPAGVLRQWAWRPIVVADLMKAGRESLFPEVRRPQRKVLINPTMDEFNQYVHKLINLGTIHSPVQIAADTETEAGQITCISFAASRAEGMTVPLWDKTKPGWSYWTEEEERQIWDHLQFLMESPRVNLLWQNGMYDYQYVTPMKIKVHRSTEDTMLLHHALYPELQKGLGFLGSLYSNEASWKLMRNWKQDTEKRDE